jgi:hypothetical protein
MNLRRGRRRAEFCAGTYGAAHRLTDSTRRWKVYYRKDGTPVVLSNGCALCNALGNRVRDGLRARA